MYGKPLIKKLLSPYGSISDKMLSILENATHKSSVEIGEILNEYLEKQIDPAEYLDKDGLRCSKSEAQYIWVPTSLYNSINNELLYIAFTKNNDLQTSEFFCYRVSSKDQLIKNREGFCAGSTQKDVLYSEIYEMLLRKEDWAALPDYRLIKELICVSEAKPINDIKSGNDKNNFVYNISHTKIAYNTGLISAYANDIIIIADIDAGNNISNRKILQSKTQLKQEGFENVDIPPVSFYKEKTDLVLQATPDDFDLNDLMRIKHIIQYRRDRLPEDMKEMTDDEIVGRIKASLEFDLKVLARNPQWAAPFYSIKEDSVQYFLPVFSGSFCQSPSLAIVIGRGEHYYDVRTILPLKLAYANAVCLTNPPAPWLKETNEKETVEEESIRIDY